MLAGSRAVGERSSVDTLLATFSEDAGAPGRDPIYGYGILTLASKVSVALSAEEN